MTGALRLMAGLAPGVTRVRPAVAGCILLALAAVFGCPAADAITFTPIATGFNNPVGIDHHAPTNRLVLSVNYPDGLPYNFELVAADGSRQQFSSISGFSDEVKIATAKDDGGGMSMGGFTAGELFTGSGVPGVIARIAADGSSVQDPWVTLPDEPGLMRGSLYVDRTGVFGGDLIVVTTTGGVWRVTSGGTPTFLANVGTHLEGLVTVPNDAGRYGPWAGKILAGAEDQGLIYSIAPNGSTSSYALGINPEDIDIVPANQNFFGIDFSSRTLWGADASQWSSIVGDIIMAQEYGPLWHVRWNGSSFETDVVSNVAQQWEHVTFSTAGVPCVPPVCTITGDSAICQGQTTELCGPVAQGATYSWSGPGDFASSNRCITVGGAGTYTLDLTVPCPGSIPDYTSSQCSKDLLVHAAPVCTITGSDSICAGQTGQLCGPEGDFTYLWSTGATTRCIAILEEGSYTLTVTNPTTGCSSTSGSSSVPTRSAWQMHDGLEVTQDNPLGLVAFSCSPVRNGDPCEYDVATIPVAADPGWGPALDPNTINFSVVPSRVCQAQVQCFAYGDFTYFQTLVDIPLSVNVTEFTISFSGMDDGCRVSIFNSAYPAGLVVPGSYVFLGETGTTNLAPYVVSGEVNRVAITQVDDCCSENNLRSAVVVLNGQSVNAGCSKFVRMSTCGPPPAVVDAFPTFDNDLDGGDRLDSVMVVFDRPVEKTSAENLANYFLDSEGEIDGAQRLDAPDDNRVVLQIRNQLPDGGSEGITVSGIRSLEGGTSMPTSMNRPFRNGVLELAEIDAPDPDALAGGECQDRSRFLSGMDAPDDRVSFTGTVTGVFGEDYAIQDVPGLRAGLWVHLPGASLIPGHTYLLAGAIRNVAGETQGTNIVYTRDLGQGPSFVPAIQSVRILTDETCDAEQRFLTGKDYEGMLVTVDRVTVAESAPAGASFRVGFPITQLVAFPRALANGPADQILIANPAGNFTFAATAGEIVTVTGILGRVDGVFAIFPPNDAAIIAYGPVPTFSLPLDVSKSATQSRDPDVVRDGNGRLFMAWWRDHHDTVHSLSLDNTLNWSAALPVMRQGAQPALAVTPSNKIGVLGAGVNELFFTQSTDGGFRMDPLVTSLDAHATRYPAMTVGLGEHFHAAWERVGAGSGVFYSRSLTGGDDFSSPSAIALNGANDTNSLARICASAQDHVFVFWQYDLPGAPGTHRVLYRRSVDAGTNFDPARRVRDESNPLTSTVKLTSLGDAQIGPDGTLYVMGLDEAGGIAFLRSTNDGLTFGLASYLPEPAARGGLCPKSFAVGADGAIHALVGVCGTALYYTRSDDGGATWGPAVNVSSASSPTVGEPRGAKIILDGSGTPVIVWFSAIGGSTEIYSTRLLN